MPLADTQESILPPFHALCWSDQACERSPLHWAVVSVLPDAPLGLKAQGYWRLNSPFGWLKTL